MPKTYTIHVKRKWIILGVASIVLLMVAAPVAVVASHQFTDVDDNNIFHADIAWMADNGITKGCNPPTNDKYCPTANVTREQMGAFMHRLADSQAVDAGTLDGMDNSEFARVPVITRLQYTGTSSVDFVDEGVYEQIETIGTFTKVYADTDVLLQWRADGTVSGAWCEFQLRVDGAKDTGSTSTSFEATSGGSAVLRATFMPISVPALFPGLSAGDHEVTVWVRGAAVGCGLNANDFGQDLLVTESPLPRWPAQPPADFT